MKNRAVYAGLALGFATASLFFTKEIEGMKRRCRLNLMAVTFVACLCSAGDAAEIDPPLPIPTEEQLQKGRELLDKIVYVVDKVPLSDEVAVMKVFGIAEVKIWESASYRMVLPKGTGERRDRAAELEGTGLTALSLMPWIRSEKDDALAWLSGHFSADENCISIEDVREKFTSRAKKISTERIITAPPTLSNRPRLHDADLLVFTGVENPTANRAIVALAFRFQRCATSLHFSYRKN